MLNILGTKINIVSFEELVNYLKNNYFKKPAYICFSDIIVLNESIRNKKLQEALNESSFNLPDGKTIELYSKLKGINNCKTISGYWLIHELLNTNKSHYFYWGSKEKYSKLLNYISKNYPNANIKGHKSPPFVTINDIINNKTIRNDIEAIKNVNPDFIWIGIGGIKQDILMHTYYNVTIDSVMIGVGAVLDYLIGDTKKSPEWIKKIYLRWLYRLIMNPKKGRFKRVIGSFFGFLIKITFYDKGPHNYPK